MGLTMPRGQASSRFMKTGWGRGQSVLEKAIRLRQESQWGSTCQPSFLHAGWILFGMNYTKSGCTLKQRHVIANALRLYRWVCGNLHDQAPFGAEATLGAKSGRSPRRLPLLAMTMICIGRKWIWYIGLICRSQKKCKMAQ